MSSVRRCDNPACTNGPGGSVQVSDVANPAGWAVVTAEILLAEGDPIRGDYCTVECAGAALLAGRGFKIVADNQGGK